MVAEKKYYSLSFANGGDQSLTTGFQSTSFQNPGGKKIKKKKQNKTRISDSLLEKYNKNTFLNKGRGKNYLKRI